MQANRSRILVVEDEPSICDNITYALESEGMEPVTAATGADALRLISSESFDLVLLDVGLPDSSGFDLCRQIRQNHATPVIFITARSDEVDRIVGLEIGGDDYVVKPFSPRELTARVRAVLRRSSNQPNPPPPTTPNPNHHSSGPFEIDHDRMEIRFCGKPLTLSRYEFRLLRTFIARPGRVFTRGQLMDHAWEEPEASLERTIDAHIRSLRAKMRSINPDIEPILTHRGTGYSLNESA